MKTAISLSVLVLLAGMAQSGLTQNAPDTDSSSQTAPSETFSGKIVFHQKVGHVIYNVTITNGQISGYQGLDFDPAPIARFVGGWFDSKHGKLSLLIQGTAEGLDTRWRSQAQQFTIDANAKTVVLEHMLYDFGLTLISSVDTPTEHILDNLDESSSPEKADAKP